MDYQVSTFVEVLRRQALVQPQQVAYSFVADAEGDELTLTYGELDRRARAIGAVLQALGAEGERALLLYPPGLDYIAAFFGCLYAGVTAVPAYPPRSPRSLPRVQAIVADAQARFALTTSASDDGGPDLAAGLSGLQWVATGSLESDSEDGWREPNVESDSLAFLQYTSGSTGTPKGVMVSHGNLLHNSALLERSFGYTPVTRCVTWLPLYHDMGLIGGVLQPLYGGFHNTLLSPLSFLRNPARWLEIISRTEATLSGGPNFAYDLCARKVTPEQAEALNLRHWSVAFTGADLVRAETLERFARAFAPSGFRREAFFPCYGLAEATLLVSGGPLEAAPVERTVEREALAAGRVRELADGEDGAQVLVGCGAVPGGQRVVIARPETRTLCAPEEVGEIWVAGDSVARGYWNRPEETEKTFRARLAEACEETFLRTGDLGYFDAGQLFITGRLKDLIIIRGRNHYPQDIELTVEQSHAALRPGCGAAFAVEEESEERLVVVQEVERRPVEELDEVVESVRHAVAEEHELQVYAVVLVKPKSIPKTSSGKIQRRACREAYLAGELRVVKSHAVADAAEEVAAPSPAEVLSAEEPERKREALENYLREQVTGVIGYAVSREERKQPLSYLGLDSLMAVELQGNVEGGLGVTLPMLGYLQSQSIAQLTEQILELLSAAPELQESDDAPRQQGGAVQPLTQGQRGLWFLHQLAPESAAYNIARAVRVAAALDAAALGRAFQSLVDRHDSLRATFEEVDGEPVQRVAERANVYYLVEDAAVWSEASLRARLTEEAHRPFDLARGPLLRVHLFKRSAEEYVLLLVVHHVVTDFWSLAVMLRELAELYRAELKGEPAELPPLKRGYGDYARWQAEALRGPEGERLWTYWRRRLAGPLSVLNLPFDRPRPLVQTYRGDSHFHRFDAGLAAQLKALGRAHGATLYTTLLAAFYVLLYRHTGQSDLVVGSPTNGRPRAEWKGVVGYFANTVPMRADLSGNPTFTALLARVRQTVQEGLEHQYYPLTLLVEHLQPERDASHAPIFQVMFSLQKSHLLDEQGIAPLALGESGARVKWGELDWETLGFEQRVAQFDVTLVMAEADDELAASLEYNTALFDAPTAERLLHHFGTLLESIAADPTRRLSELSLLTSAERDLMLRGWNETAHAYARDTCVHELFEAQARRVPSAVAAATAAGEITYAELDARANQLAHHLRRLGIGPEDLVAICVERSVEMLVGLLGILKAGGAYVPLDPSYPTERLSVMLEDARPAVLLTQAKLVARLPHSAARVVRLDADWESIAQEKTLACTRAAAGDNLAYVIFTSGSSGRPKGVQITHAAVVNFLSSMAASPGLTAEDRLLSVTTLSFDIAGLELFLPLSVGARLILLSREIASDGTLLSAELEASRATVMQATPATWRMLIEADWGGSEPFRILCGGEALSRELAAQLLERGSAVWNMYGPTETTIWSTCSKVEGNESLSIGRPIANTQVYLLDEELSPVPVGVAGELYIGGDGLARGYLKRPGLTAEKFVPDPFAGVPGARLYRTADLARYTADGQVEYLGRADYQVKIRGHRIEPGEIEEALATHPAVRERVVVADEDASGERRLVAYVVPAEPASPPTSNELRGFLKEKLPEYMIPAAFVLLEELPLTPNNKINRHALPAPEFTRAELADEFIAPRTPTEELLAGTFAQVLGVEQVGVHDNFFELGGHSLLATQVVSRTRSLFHVEVALRSLFEAPTVAGLSEVVEAALLEERGVIAPPLVRIPREAPLPLSFAQQRLLFLDQLEPGHAFYNMPAALRLRGRLDVAALEQSLSEIVRRHEVLRTTLTTVEGEWVQVVHAPSEFRLAVEDLSGSEGAEAEALRRAAEEACRSFNLSAAPPLRVQLLRLAAEEHVVLLTLHHIAGDGWSLGVLIREFGALYNAFTTGEPSPLPEPEIQYGDFAIWQRRWLRGETLDRQLDYWREQLADLPTLRLPTDRPRPAVQGFRGASLTRALPAAPSELLREFNRHEDVTLFMTLLAAFDVLLHYYGGQDEIVVGTDISNRTRLETEGLIGFFTNQLVMRTDVAGDPSFRQLLARVREVTLGAYAHQDLPFEMLVKALKVKRDRGLNSLFQAKLVLQNAPLTGLSLVDLEPEMLEVNNGTAKFDLLLTVTHGEHELHCQLEYNTDIFSRRTAARLLEHFELVLGAAVAEPEATLSALGETLRRADADHRLSKQKELKQAQFKKLKALGPKRPGGLRSDA